MDIKTTHAVHIKLRFTEEKPGKDVRKIQLKAKSDVKTLRGKALEKLRRVILPRYDKKNQCHVKV